MTLLESRLEICKQCPLYETMSYGARCNPSKYINKEGETSWIPKPGYVKGCNCILKRKAANPDNHCIINKW